MNSDPCMNTTGRKYQEAQTVHTVLEEYQCTGCLQRLQEICKMQQPMPEQRTYILITNVKACYSMPHHLGSRLLDN
jgi:hypothetical protein